MNTPNLSPRAARELLDKLSQVIGSLTVALITFAALAVTGNASVGGALTINGLIATSVSHTFADTTAWTLSATEQAATVLLAGGTSGGAADIVATPTLDKLFVVKNTSGSNVTIKADGQTGVTVADGATAIVVGNGTDFV